MQTQNKQSTQFARKRYVAPILEDYGPVRELTNAGLPFYPSNDSSNPPLYYSSTPN